MTGNSVYRTVGIVFADTRADHLGTDERSNTAYHMNGSGTGEIVEAHLCEPAAAPNPVTADWIDNSADYYAVNAIYQEVGTFCHSTGNNSCCGCTEHSLEDEVGCARIAGTVITFYEEVRRSDKAANIGTKHQAKAQNPENYGTEAHIHDVLHDDVAGVFSSGKACFNHCEARLHREYQEGTYQHPYSIDRYIFVHL